MVKTRSKKNPDQGDTPDTQKARDMKAHILVNSNESSDCNICGEHFGDKEDLKLHLEGHSEQKPLRCDICGSLFTTEDLLKSHMSNHELTHAGSMPQHAYCCTVCGTLSGSEDELNKHMTEHKNKEGPVCKSEEVKIEPDQSLEAYITSYFDATKMLFCHICGSLFNSREHLQTHLAGHLNQQKPKISGENVNMADSVVHKTTFPDSEKSEEHKRKKPLFCHVCGKLLNTEANLQAHIKTHPEKTDSYCNYCGKLFEKSDHLNRQCRFCGKLIEYKAIKGSQTLKKGFASKGNFNRHMLTHAEKSPHQCTFCHMGFMQLRSLKKHLLSHDNDLKTCHVCGKSFSHAHHLHMHVQTHNESSEDTSCDTDGSKSREDGDDVN